MKRSKTIKLAFISTVPILFSACSQQTPAVQDKAYSSVADCTAAGQFTQDECTAQYNNAMAQHLQTAPRFNSIDSCAQQYGYDQCQPHRDSSGQSFFLPALAGYMVGRALSQQNDYRRDDPRYGYAGGSYGAYSSQPLYKTRDDRTTWRTAGNEPVPAANIPAAKPMTTAETLSRGGFGSSSAARSSWGG